MKPLIIVRADRLGDSVVSSALLAPLKALVGARPLVWCVQEAYAPLYASLPGVATISSCALVDYVKAQEAGADVVLLNPLPQAEAVLENLKGVTLYGWGRTLRDTRKACARPEAAYCAELLAVAGYPVQPALPLINLQELPAALALRFPQLGAKPYVALHVSRSGDKPALPVATLIAVSQYLLMRGVTPVWLGNEPHRADVVALRAHPVAAQVLDCVGSLSVLEQAWVLKHAVLTLGRDSGLTHLAGGLGVPTLCVVGPVGRRAAYRRWTPMGAAVRAYYWDCNAHFWERTLAYQERYFRAATFELLKPALELGLGV